MSSTFGGAPRAGRQVGAVVAPELAVHQRGGNLRGSRSVLAARDRQRRGTSRSRPGPRALLANLCTPTSTPALADVFSVPNERFTHTSPTRRRNHPAIKTSSPPAPTAFDGHHDAETCQIRSFHLRVRAALDTRTDLQGTGSAVHTRMAMRPAARTLLGRTRPRAVRPCQ